MGLFSNDILRVRSYRYQKSYNFECVLPPTGIADPLKVSRLVQAVEYSDYEMDSNELMKYGIFDSHFAGTLSKKPFTITFNETEEHDVKRYLHAWRNLIVDRFGRYKKKKGLFFGYAKPIFLHYMNNEGNTTNVVRFRHSFPVTFNNWTVSYNESNVQKIEATFVCDYVEDLRELAAAPVEDFITAKIKDTTKFTQFL